MRQSNTLQFDMIILTSEYDNNKLANLDRITIKRNSILNQKIVNENYVDGEKTTTLRFNQVLEIFSKVNIGGIVYNPIEDNKQQIIDTTKNELPNPGGNLLQQWDIKGDDKINRGKKTKLSKSSLSSTPTESTGAPNIPPICNSFMFIETNSIIFGPNVFCSFERTAIIQISFITFYFNRYSNPRIEVKAMGNFRILFLLPNRQGQSN